MLALTSRSAEVNKDLSTLRRITAQKHIKVVEVGVVGRYFCISDWFVVMFCVFQVNLTM
jgi:hypothetical protein